MAIVSRVGIEKIESGFASGADEQGCRIMSALCGGTRSTASTCRTAASSDSEFYEAKLDVAVGVAQATRDEPRSLNIRGRGVRGLQRCAG